MTFRRDLAWHQLDLVHRSSVAHQAARYALAVDYAHLPADVVHQAKRCVLDALGCAIGAYDAPGRTICEETVRELGGPEEATIFGSGLRTSAANAALVNSYLVRFLDFNDLGGGGHNSDALASLLAVAERHRAHGKDFLTSLVISYELGARFREAITGSLEDLGWPTDIRAGFNQPPALGKLMGLDEEQIANAIGLCLSHTLPLGILDSHREEMVMAKNVRFGWAAHDAILACMLARRGFTGPVRAIESDAGVRGVVVRGAMDLERLTDFSGWRILGVWFKTLAANGTTHGHVLATLGIVVEHDLAPADIAAVHIKGPPRERRHTTTPSRKYPRNAESADHSAFYANAMAIRERAFGAAAVRPEKFTDPVVLELIEKITVDEDPGLGTFQGASEVVTVDGRRFFKRVDVPHGFADDPLSDRELEEKFGVMAQAHMGDRQIARILDACWNVEKLQDLRPLAALMAVPGATGG